jgi:alginate O-acetyltransferase complex protein AlgI
MQFNSLTFIVFFAVVVALYGALSSWTVRKALLVAASYLFYAAWNPLFVVLLWISTIADWTIARRIAAAEERHRKRLLVTLSLLINLGLLGYFKYGGFLLENFVSLMGGLGIEYVPPAASIVLPIGISFYTFQTLSYTLDVYRGQMQPRYSLLDFSLFVSFFPQLVAGPIVRASQFLPQCVESRRATADSMGWGLTLIAFGLFAKVVLADSVLAPVADAVFGAPDTVGTLEAWLGVFAFSGQIFFDFSGYSTCAIGAAMCLGFSLPDNFRSPYAAIGFSDFWRRWHISLSQWLRDYLYVSLGGNRKGEVRTIVNLVITMFLGGLWHGASWMFVIWGSLHGIYLVVEHGARSLFGGIAVFGSRPARAAFGVLTFVIVSMTWVFFRAADMDTATSLLTTMTVPTGMGSLVFVEQLPVIFFVLLGLVIWHWVSRDSNLEIMFEGLPLWARVIVISTVVVSIIYSGGGAQHAFIYFQF